MCPEFISVPIETESGDIAEIGLDYMAANIVGWEPSPAQLDTIMIEAGASMIAEASDTASDVPVTIYRDYGFNILGIAPVDENPAYVSSTWTVIDNSGHTIPAGTAVLLTNAASVTIPFTTEFDVTIPPGSTSTAVGEVSLIADEGYGSSSNGCSGTAQLIDSIFWINTITLVSVSAGGEDAESDGEYLQRLVQEVRLMGPKPVLAQDFAVMAKRIAGVYRATYIDNYNLDTATANQERCVTVIVTDENGNAVPTSVLTAVDNYLESLREVNFLVFVGNATYNTVNVTFTAMAYPGWDINDVDLRAEAAVRTYFSPLNWGLPTDETDDTHWFNKVRIRSQELYTILNNTPGLDYVTALTFQIGAGANDVNDKDLTGIAPLPTPGTINGTITSP